MQINLARWRLCNDTVQNLSGSGQRHLRQMPLVCLTSSGLMVCVA